MRLDFSLNIRDRPGHLRPGDNAQNARSPDYPLCYDPLGHEMLGRIVTLHAVGVAFFEIAGPDNTRIIDQTLRSVLACALEQVVISNFPNQKSVAMPFEYYRQEPLEFKQLQYNIC